MDLNAHVKGPMNWRPLKTLILLWAAWGAALPAVPAWAASKGLEPRVSVSAKGKPLGEVLDAIGREAGRQFHMDPAWRGHSVTVEFQDTPLDTALKRVLDGLNSAIIYRPDASIRLVIIGTPPAGGAAPSAPPPKTSLRRPIDRGPIAPPRGSIPPPAGIPPPEGANDGAPRESGADRLEEDDE
jgi:hypothetical protein